MTGDRLGDVLWLTWVRWGVVTLLSPIPSQNHRESYPRPPHAPRHRRPGQCPLIPIIITHSWGPTVTFSVLCGFNHYSLFPSSIASQLQLYSVNKHFLDVFHLFFNPFRLCFRLMWIGPSAWLPVSAMQTVIPLATFLTSRKRRFHVFGYVTSGRLRMWK